MTALDLNQRKSSFLLCQPLDYRASLVRACFKAAGLATVHQSKCPHANDTHTQHECHSRQTCELDRVSEE